MEEMTKQNEKISRLHKTVLRMFFAVSIIGALIWFHRKQLLHCLGSFDYRFVLPALLCYFLQIAAGAWRWRRLALLQGFNLSGFEAFSLTMQGCFFSLVIPGGAIGGDVVKMGLLAKRRQPGSRAEGIFTVFMDRITGMIALFALAIVLLLKFFPKIPEMQIPGISINTSGIQLAALGVLLLCTAGITAGIAVFFHRVLRKIPGINWILEKIDSRFNNMASRMTAMADEYAKYPGTVALLTVASIFFVHLVLTLPLCFLLAGAGVDLNMEMLILTATAVTVGNIAGLIPLTPGGIGLRDLTVIAILSAGGINAGTGEAAQLMSTGLYVIVNLCGGFFFAFDGSRIHSTGNRNE